MDVRPAAAGPSFRKEPAQMLMHKGGGGSGGPIGPTDD
jgi:hypothetical protein